MPGLAHPPTRAHRLLAVILALGLLGLSTGCSNTEDGVTKSASPDELPFTDDQPAEPTTTTTPAPTTTTEPPPVPLGTPGDPFLPLPKAVIPRAALTPSGMALPITGERNGTWQVLTACENTKTLEPSAFSPIGRAHLVLDPGHGGTEIGTVGPSGIMEKDINLAVANQTAKLLEAKGATVILTRVEDVNTTTRYRGQLAAAIDPALFVSIHHNGGARPSSNKPGTLVFTKTESPESTRFGGLFYDRMTALATSWAAPKQQAYTTYRANLDAYLAKVATYDQSVSARDNALFANGQIPATTLPDPLPQPADGIDLPPQRTPTPTTTIPPTAESTIPVPDTATVPSPFTEPPVRNFLFAGGPNAGVRSWVRADGQDYLSILRHSDDVPTALAEFLFLTNPSEEELLLNPDFLAAQSQTLADSIIAFFTGDTSGSGFVQDQYEDQPIGGGGLPDNCIEPDYGWNDPSDS